MLAILLLTAVADPMGMHGDHELGVFDVTLGVAFAVGALRPKLAAGLAWPSGAAAAGLLVTATVDVIAHRTFELHELQHLIAVAGALLLFWAARDSRRGPQGVRRDLAAPAPASPELTGVTQLQEHSSMKRFGSVCGADGRDWCSSEAGWLRLTSPSTPSTAAPNSLCGARVPRSQ